VSRRSLMLLALLCAGLLAWGIERLIVTDREAIEAVVERGAAAVERGDWDAVAAMFDDAAGRTRRSSFAS
jgi:hypothetical protein